MSTKFKAVTLVIGFWLIILFAGMVQAQPSKHLSQKVCFSLAGQYLKQMESYGLDQLSKGIDVDINKETITELRYNWKSYQNCFAVHLYSNGKEIVDLSLDWKKTGSGTKLSAFYQNMVDECVIELMEQDASFKY